MLLLVTILEIKKRRKLYFINWFEIVAVTRDLARARSTASGISDIDV